jgi:hypothetical protein
MLMNVFKVNKSKNPPFWTGAGVKTEALFKG